MEYISEAILSTVKTYSQDEMMKYEKEKEKLFKDLSFQNDKEREINKAKKYKFFSIIDNKFNKSKFENSENNELIKLVGKYSLKFIENGTAPFGLFIHGGVGNGKTFTVSCLANDLLENGKGVLFMNFALYLNKIRAGYSEKEENHSIEQDILEYVKTCDLLIIDDLGVESIKPFVKEKLFNLIDTRYRSEKPLIITSNLNIEGIASAFGDRVADRIKGCTHDIHFKDKSRRKVEINLNDWLNS